MKKILIVANDIDWVYSLRKELIDELCKIYKVVLCIPECKNSFKMDYFKKVGVNFVFVNFQGRNKNPFRDLGLFKKYLNVIKKVNPDVVLTYTIKPNIYGTYAASIYKKPVIMNITGIGSAFINPKLKYIVSTLYKQACKKAYLIFFQNRSNYSLFISKKIADSNKAKIIPGSGVNIDKFIPMDKLNKDKITRFLFIGRIMKEKGIEEYLQVAEHITKKHDNTEFQILGRFEEEKYKEVILNNDNPRIKYLGISDDVREEIRDVDCIIHPTFYPEGMSNVLLEGAAMGKPLIASNIPGCKEIIDEGYNGYLFEVKSVESLEEKIVQFLKLDEKIKENMGKNSREKVVKEFDRNIVISEYMKAINNILKEGYSYESI